MSVVIDGAEVTAEELAAARRYPMLIEWSDEDALFLASFPDVPGLRTHGTTYEEAARQGEELIVVWLTAMVDAGRSVPPPSITARQRKATPAPVYDAARIRSIRYELNMSQQVFADVLNVSKRAVSSWEQGIRQPEGAVMRLLSIAEKHPAILLETMPKRAKA